MPQVVLVGVKEVVPQAQKGRVVALMRMVGVVMHGMRQAAPRMAQMEAVEP